MPIEFQIDRSTPYPSCPWIEGGLSFSRHSLRSCLIVHHHRGYPYLSDFNGGEVDIQTVLTARARIIRENQQGVHDACIGCSHLKTMQWPEPVYPFRLLGIAHFSRCNISCDYCFLQWQTPSVFPAEYVPYAVLPAIQGLIRKGLLAPDAVVDWGGGEPTIYPEFDPVLRLLTESGATTFIHTNGTRFPLIFETGLQTRRIHVICSIDAGSPETWRRIKGRNLLTTVWRNIHRYRDHGCKVYLKYIVMDTNRDDRELRSFVRKAKRAGATDLLLDIDYRHPLPSTEVFRGLRRLKYLAVMGGMHVRYGFTGAQFTPEIDVDSQIDVRREITRIEYYAYRLKLVTNHVETSIRYRGRTFMNRLSRLLKRWINLHLEKAFHAKRYRNAISTARQDRA